jgi:hypothetical protein
MTAPGFFAVAVTARLSYIRPDGHGPLDARRHRPGGARRRGDVTPRELVARAIERIERVNPKLNAVITPLFEKALAAASPAPARRPVPRRPVSC